MPLSQSTLPASAVCRVQLVLLIYYPNLSDAHFGCRVDALHALSTLIKPAKPASRVRVYGGYLKLYPYPYPLIPLPVTRTGLETLGKH